MLFGRKNLIKYQMYGFVSRHLEFLLLFSVAIIMTIVTIYTWDVKYHNQNNPEHQNEIDFSQNF